MSGEVKQNSSVASGAIGAAATATESASNPTVTANPESVGAEWHNTTSGQIFICIDNAANANAWVGQKGGYILASRALCMGGGASSASDDEVIDYIDIATLGNATDFGDLTQGRFYSGACANEVRAVCGPGYWDAAGGTVNKYMDYVTIASTGNAAAFGEWTVPPFCTSGGHTAGNAYAFGTTSNASNDRGVWAGGSAWTDKCTTISYITISSASDITDFGDMIGPKRFNSSMAMTSNGTNDRGIIAGGYGASTTGGGAANAIEIEYITITSTGNSTDFGDLTTAKRNAAACSSGTDERALFGGGHTTSPDAVTDVIEYITINSTGNGTDFGDLLSAMNNGCVCATSSGVGGRAVWMGAPSSANTIQYASIGTLGNSVDFGDLSVGRDNGAAVSDANAG
tara:strand:- start:208 stop:1404 length:1197 start_codon:yes stop_codon:yes gene_type:complete